jgi:hypothetical protein
MVRRVPIVLALLLLSARAAADEPAPGAPHHHEPGEAAHDHARPPAPARRGAVVMAKNADVLPAAKALARAAYRDATLRPQLDEKTARIAAGEAPAAVYGEALVPDKQAELARVRQAALEAADPAIAARLLASLGRDLAVELVVVVEPGEHGPTARALSANEERFLPMLLSPKEGVDWSDAVVVLRGLATPAVEPPAPAPPTPAVKRRRPPAPTTPPAKDAKEKGKGGSAVLTSPWFWGGLGVVVAAGVTVLVLSQTALNKPQTVELNGHIAP